ncbi:MAG: zf-HC2 domain-containing protein [candidate division Zixibacteria bacterium]|nr:zf-HC2 domain-containing protein [candidate division Zixibacteria bacterium]
MTNCTDKNLGALLPAYELGALSDEDEKRLEIHLMQCEHCLNEVVAFEKYAGVLRNSSKIKKAMARHAQPTQSITSTKTLIRYLWPDAPLVFKPAICLLLVLLMVIPTLIGLRVMIGDTGDVRPVQMIRLIPTRATATNVLSIGAGLDAAISFAVPDYSPGRLYDLLVIDDRGGEVVRLDSFGSIDERGMGQIIIPNRVMKPGSYHLIVTCAGSNSTTCKLKYTFKIDP